MRFHRVLIGGVALSVLGGFASAWAESGLGLTVVKVKPRGGWTEVVVAVENLGSEDLEFQCCKAFLESTDGYAIASLNQSEARTQIHNKARTASLIGTIVGAGLGLGGAIGGVRELGYAGLGVAGASAIAGVAGEASAEKGGRDLIIDDIMRNQLFPAGLKVTGVVYFPPKKKWPGSKKAQALHLTYRLHGKSRRVTAPISH